VPELPEVETIVRDLRPVLVGRRISSVQRTSAVKLRRPWDSSWSGLLAGRQIDSIDRRGKWIVWRLEDGAFLVFHLGMTGQLTVVEADTALPDHLHLVINLEGSTQQIRFRDTRRFGSSTRFANLADLEAHFKENGLGPEPFGLDPKSWRSALAGTTRAIKSVLLDQTVVAGVGNIYADEALFVAQLHPMRRACDLSRTQAECLRIAIEEVLKAAIDKRGSTIRDYVGGSGLAGGYQEEFRAYNRKGEPCSRCGTLLAALRLGGRSAHYCPKCQKAPRKTAQANGEVEKQPEAGPPRSAMVSQEETAPSRAATSSRARVAKRKAKR
jgi:formamidopyrimidine-DNA glycosylase